MLRYLLRLSANPLRFTLCLLALTVGLAAAFVACGEQIPVSPTPVASDSETFVSYATPSPSASDAETVAPRTSSMIHAVPQPPFYGAGTPSVDERIYESDVIVKASLLSAADGLLRFRAIEYLKGAGASEFIIQTSTIGRNTSWDGLEAVLFLSLPESQGATGSSDSPAAQFTFTESWAVKHYSGNLPEGYTIGTRNPAWLPAESISGATGASGGSQAFITDAQSPTGALSPVSTLADIRAKIAWQEGGEGVEGYDDCVFARLNYERFYRNWETYYGRTWTLHQTDAQVGSGTGRGSAIYASGVYYEHKYRQVWLTGVDAELFSAQIIDDDETPSNGFSWNITTARPLSGRTYNFIAHGQLPKYMPCSFIPPNHRLEWLVTVTPPPGTLHEAFFDPVTIGVGVGVDASNGVLNPALFSIGGTSTSITGLKWESGSIVLSLSPYVSLSGHKLDFIELDGTVSLSLAVSSATEDTTAGALTWTITNQPWHNGDTLMLLISTLAVTP